MKRVYVASSWRNSQQNEVVKVLRDAGHSVYDFKHPEPGNNGFAWSDIDPFWKNWNNQEFKAALRHPIAEKGFRIDLTGMIIADFCVLVLPCGRSAHLEAGWMGGKGKKVIILQSMDYHEPELMYGLCDLLTDSMPEVLKYIADQP